jgi:hypothetical protein
MEKRHWLMNWPTETFHEGFYVTMRGKQYMLGHLSRAGDSEVFQADHQHTIDRPAYMVLKAIASENLRLIRAANLWKEKGEVNVRKCIADIKEKLKDTKVCGHTRTLLVRQLKYLKKELI